MDFKLSSNISYFIHNCSGNFDFILLSGALQQLFSPSIEEIVVVKIKQNGTCIVEASDGIPSSVKNCPYSQGQNFTIYYKQGLSSIERYQ